MSDDLKRELVRVKIEKAREAMGEATWCFDGEKPAKPCTAREWT